MDWCDEENIFMVQDWHQVIVYHKSPALKRGFFRDSRRITRLRRTRTGVIYSELSSEKDTVSWYKGISRYDEYARSIFE